MFQINYYATGSGRQPVKEWLDELQISDLSRWQKIHAYLELLAEHGTTVGEPEVKHLEGKIWELRPRADRVLFAAWMGNELVLLHHFVKKTNKTPRREIEIAQRRFDELSRRPNNVKNRSQTDCRSAKIDNRRAKKRR